MEKNTVLCVDDDVTLLHALRTLLSAELGLHCWVEIAESGEEALELAAELQQRGRPIAVVISDYIMPGMRGDELLAEFHCCSPRTVKILLTGQSDIGGVKRAINDAGLYRFIEKPFDNDDVVLTTRTALHAFEQEREIERQNEQLRRVNAELETLVAERTRELVEKNAELERMAVTDRLTGLFNRHRLDQILADECAREHRYGAPFAVALVDIDHFKAVNDEFGHQAGDRVLVELAGLLAQHTRHADVAGRWGGEEFLLIFRHTTLDGARTSADKLRGLIAAYPFAIVGHRTVSFGVAASGAGETPEQLLARADAALYRAKENGRNRVEVAAAA